MSSSRSDDVTQFVVSRTFQGCFTEVSRVSQGSFKGVLRKFQGCFMEVLRVILGSFKGVSRNFQGCFRAF